MKIRFVGVPPGQAPDWVRAEWFDVVVESSGREDADGDDPFAMGATGGKRENVGGYIVDGGDALAALLAKGTNEASRAADWWKTRSVLVPGRQLIFHADVCELVPEDP